MLFLQACLLADGVLFLSSCDVLQPALLLLLAAKPTKTH